MIECGLVACFAKPDAGDRGHAAHFVPDGVDAVIPENFDDLPR